MKIRVSEANRWGNIRASPGRKTICDFSDLWQVVDYLDRHYRDITFTGPLAEDAARIMAKFRYIEEGITEKSFL